MEVRKASHLDGQFILDLIVRNSRNHFNPAFIEPRCQESLVQQIKQTIDNGQCPMPRSTYSSRLLVSEIDNKVAAFLWTLQKSENETEVYLVAVAPEHREKGVAKHLLQYATSRLKPGDKITSRVKRKSNVMKTLLKKMGFKGKFYLPFRPQVFQNEVS